MKKFLFGMATLIACAAMFSACSDDSTEKTPDEDKSDKMVSFLTYGFYAEDNTGLTTDYVAEIKPEMIIRLPGEVDRSKLIARFTTSEGDVVTIGTTMQVSGQTANDFSYPIDYIVKDDASKLTARYTVKVGKILSKVWTQVASYNEIVDGATLVNDDFSMAICPKTKNPYFFLARDNSASIAAGVVVKLSDGVMTPSSEISFAADGTTAVDAKNPDIAIDADGKVYAMYYNTTATSKMFVKTGSGASWSTVGATFGNTTCGSSYSIEIDPATKRPIVGYFANSAFGSVIKRDLNMCYYDGSTWSSENLVADISGKTIYNNVMRIMNGALYMGGLVQNHPGSLYFVYKYNNGVWEKVVSALPEGVSQTNIVGLSFAVATDGTVYGCFGGDEDLNGTWQISVYKSTPGTDKWTRVSTAIDAKNKMSSSSRYQMDLCQDQPVVFYKDPITMLPMIVSLNPETKQWSEPMALGAEVMGTKAIKMEFDANGVGYAAFFEGTSKTNSLKVYKFDTEADNLPK